jgi:DNA-binding MarR family transcriptional regulator
MSDDHHATLLEVVLRLHGDFRRSLEPIRVTPLQAGLMLYLHRCAAARVTEAAHALRVRPPTLTEVVHDLVRKGWVSKRQSAEDGRVVRLRLSRQGQAIARKIEHQVRHIEATLTQHDGYALGINLKRSRA